jgi:hypothetical protein
MVLGNNKIGSVGWYSTVNLTVKNWEVYIGCNKTIETRNI